MSLPSVQNEPILGHLSGDLPPQSTARSAFLQSEKMNRFVLA